MLLTKQQLNDIIIESEALYNRDSNSRAYWQDLADYFLPRKAWLNSIRTKGERVKFNFLYDSTGISAARDLAAGVYTYLTNPTTRWIDMQFRKSYLNKRIDVRRFNKEVIDWGLSKLNDAGFYNVNLEWLMDHSVFGQGTFGMFEDSKRFVKFKELPVDKVHRLTDDIGNLNEIYIDYRLEARQADKLFNGKSGESVGKSLEQKKPFEEFDFIHYVGPRHEREAGKEDSGNMPMKSIWIAKKDKHLISESGFIEMPYISEVFYRDHTDPNGFSPSMDCLAEEKLVNAMMRTIIRGAMKRADPPYIMPSRGFVLPLNLNPAAMNYRDAKTAKDDLQTLPVGTGDIGIGVDLIELVVRKIQNTMFVDLFRSLNEVTKQMTVLETQQRISQAMALLGPVINRFTNAYSLMWMRLINMGVNDPMSDFPMIPEDLQHEEFDFIFLSPLAKAQRQSEIVDIQSFLADVQAIGSVMPHALDKINEDHVVDTLHRIRGITPDILRDDQDVEQIRKQRAEQEQMIAAMQMGGGLAQVAKTGAEAQKIGSEVGVK